MAALCTISLYAYERWNSGYEGYLFWNGLSSTMVDSYSTGITLSGENVWPLSTEGRFPPISGQGWHIALSGITWKTNTSAVNIRQKQFGPPLQLKPNQDGTLFWDVSTGQTAYLNLTQDITLTATKVFNVNKGGKYTLWVSLDYCPLPGMNIYFSPDTYRIEVVKYPRSNSFISNSNVISLSANNITKIDFVYDGTLMLGKATHYKIFLPTTDDLYFEGLGNSLRPNPYYVNGIREPNSYIIPGQGLKIEPFSNTFTSVSAIYIAGSGVNISYFGQGTNFFNFSLIGPSWLTVDTLSNTRELTSSFDRVFGNLSGSNDLDSYNSLEFASDLFATPSLITAPSIMLEAYPNPPYNFTKFNLIPVPTCLSSLKVDFRSAKDRDIKRITINKLSVPLTPPALPSGKVQRYNFTNERQVQMAFERVQTNERFEVFFERQAPIKGAPPILWLDPMDQYTVDSNNYIIEKIKSKPDSTWEVYEDNELSRPLLCETDVLRSAYFIISGDRASKMSINRPLTSLKIENPLRNDVSDFTTFTVVEPVSVVPGREFPVWWLGDFRTNRGYGVVLSGNKICYGSVTTSSLTNVQKYRNILLNFPIQENKPFILTNVLAGGSTKRSTVYLNGRRLTLQPGTNPTNVLSLTSFDLTFGVINESGVPVYGVFKLHSFILYNSALSPARINAINSYLIDKFYINEGYGSEDCEL